MSYKLSIKKKDDILWVTATGTRTIQTILTMSKDIMVTCVEKKVKKVLIDVRAMEGRLSIIDSYSIPDKQFPKIQNRSVVTQCAIIDLKEFEDNYRFFEIVAINRGFLLRIFSESDLAIAWLK